MKKSELPSIFDVFAKSTQTKYYDKKVNRQSLSSFYISERITLEMVLPNIKTITDIGCLNGETYQAIKEKYDHISYLGIDIDPKALEIAKESYPDAKFVEGDFMNNSFEQPTSELVLALNLFDHFSDWKAALRNLKRFSSKYINFSTLMRLSGNTIVDPDLAYLYYSSSGRRVLWAVHNIFELTSYCGTEDINATNIFVYCYTKYQPGFNNLERLAYVSFPLSPDELLVGNVLIEFDDEKNMLTTSKRPDLKIFVNGKIIFDSPWKKKNISLK